MTNRLRLFIILICTLIIRNTFTFAQENTDNKIKRQVEKAEKEKSLRTDEENKLHSNLFNLLRLSEGADTSKQLQIEYSNKIKNNKRLQADSKDRIVIYINLYSTADSKDVAKIIEALDGKVEIIGSSPFIKCRVHPKKLRDLIKIKSIKYIEKESEYIAEAVTSDGDWQLKADSARIKYTTYGFGVNIGVISDGVDNWNDVKNNYELPDMTGKILNSGSGNEGTAMLEIVHDLAPQSDLYFYSGNGGYQILAQGINALKTYCKIIVTDLRYTNEPYFTDEDTCLGATIRNFILNGGVFISSAGNYNRSVYNPRSDNMYSGKMNAAPYNYHVFPNGQNFIDWATIAGPSTSIYFQWETSWNDPSSDYDLLVFNESDSLISINQGMVRQDHGHPPIEEVEIENPSGFYRIRIKHAYGNTAPVDFKLFTFDGGIMNGSSDNRTVIGHSGFRNTVSVAAYNSDLANQIAEYSSHGPSRMFSSVAATWTYENTPTITATSKVHTYVGQSGLWVGEGHDPFQGTSAAAPHIAAIAALYYSKYPTRTNIDFINDLTMSATTIDGKGGGGVWDSIAGYGKANALECLKRPTLYISTPIINPPSGDREGTFPVTITITDSGAEIRYTIDGTEPNQANSYIYHSQFNVTSPCTVKAKGFLSGRQSLTATAIYTVPVVPLINITGISDTIIPVGQSTIKDTITFTNQLKYPNGCLSYGFIDVYIDYVNRSDLMQTPLWQGTHRFSTDFTRGQHKITLEQWEYNGVCGNSTYTRTCTVSKDFIIRDSIYITVDQTEQLGGRIGTLGYWNGSSFNPRSSPPVKYLVGVGKPQYFHADTNIYIGQKYCNWKVNNINQTEITNHHLFNLGRYDSILLSKFNPTCPATIQAQLIDGGTGGFIYFRDPWLIDSADQSHGGAKLNRGMTNAIFRKVEYNLVKPSLDTSTNYKGVFLSQPIETGKPYYTVSAPITQNDINGFTGYFQGWTKSGAGLADSISNTTGVVFNNSGATVTAKYKAHLGSSSINATTGNTGSFGNNQRKIALNDWAYHAVYCSAGSIWYIRNEFGPEWSAEKCIDKSGNAKNPSIAINDTEVYITWEVYSSADGKNNVFYQSSHDRGIHWLTSPVQLSTSSSYFAQGFDATPVVAANSTYAAIVWRYGQSGSGGIAVRVVTSSGADSTYTLSQMTSNSQLPSLTWYDPFFRIAYTDGSSIYYKEFNFNGNQRYLYIQNGPYPVSSSSSTSNTNPSIAVSSSGVVAIAWDGLNGTNRRVYYSQRNGSTWQNPPVELSHTNTTHVCTRPIICFSDIYWQGPQVSILWQCNGHIAKKMKSLTSATWPTQLNDLGAGTGPNLMEYSSSEYPTAAWTTGSGIPYRINLATLISSNTSWSDSMTIEGDYAIDSTASLTISPGSRIYFANGSKITVNGTLIANGNASQKITFDRSGASGTWGGIVYNSGSSGLLNYCTIKNATTGVTCNGYLPSISNCKITNNSTGISASNIWTSGNKISYDTIQNNTNCGIYIAYSKFICNNNFISNNGMYGINCYNPIGNLQYHPIFYNNTITSNIYGISCYTCSPYLVVLDTSLSCCPGPGHNVIKQNSVGICAGFNSYVFLGTIYYGGYDCVHNNTVHQIIANYGCTIMAQKTYWNHPNPPYYDLSDFVMNQSTITCDPALPPPDPNGCSGLSKIAANGLSDPNSHLLQKTSVSGNDNMADNIGTTSDGELALLMSLQFEGKFDEAIQQYKQVFERENNTIKGRYALGKLKECCLHQKRENEFKDYIDKSVRPKISAKDELYELLVEFDNQSLFEKQDYTGVLKNLNDILKYYTNNEAVYKHTVFDIGFLYLNSLNDRSQARKYFSQLATKYPDDQLITNAEYLLGEDLTKGGLVKKENELSLTQNEIPTEYGLSNNYPNPFNPSTVIRYQLPVESKVSVKVYDLLGREVIVLVDEVRKAGTYSAIFDASKLSSGVYFTRLIAIPEDGSKPFVQVKKMLLMK